MKGSVGPLIPSWWGSQYVGGEGCLGALGMVLPASLSSLSRSPESFIQGEINIMTLGNKRRSGIWGQLSAPLCSPPATQGLVCVSS